MGDRSVLLPYARQATVPSLTGHCQLTCLLGLKRVAYTCSKLDKVPSIDDRRQTDRLTILANHNPYPSPWPMTFILNFLRTMIMTNAHAKIKVKGRSVQKINCKQTDGVPTDGQTRQIYAIDSNFRLQVCETLCSFVSSVEKKMANEMLKSSYFITTTTTAMHIVCPLQ